MAIPTAAQRSSADVVVVVKQRCDAYRGSVRRGKIGSVPKQRIKLAPKAVCDFFDDLGSMGAMSKVHQEEFMTPTESLSPTRPSCPGSPIENSKFMLVRAKQTSSSTRHKKFFAVVRSLLQIVPSFQMITPCRWLSLPSHREALIMGSRVTGTIFGHRKGHVHFAVQEDPRSLPVLILELATPTNTLVREMASGLVRIALECEKTPNRGKLYQEPIWSMFCNGRKTGYAIRRVFSEFDRHILSVVQAVSMGAGVLPMEEESADGELMYMRARFERVIGSRDSEAFYMMNPDGSGGPELSIFLLRI
ncbi:hypothetical protein R1sor_010596 [Riccia sorocarpa]|uniref:Protein MIZU-KUSSEI 1 n=1 Tax=Riccia sorocarpa TaxID=122646 RepID=A0ABD3I236_9MARC